MRWLLAALIVPLVVLGGFVGKPIEVQHVDVEPAQKGAVVLPTGGPRAPVPTPLPIAVTAAAGDRFEGLMAAARSYLGTPYQWGGCSRSGIDCSCFVRSVLASAGINAPRVTYQQIAWATPISAADARTGDLVFFDNTCRDCGPNPTHVAMVVSPGVMIDAGDPVRIEPIYGGHNARYGRPPGL